MQHILYGDNAEIASVALLVKESSLRKNPVQIAYIDPLGANPAGFIAYSLWYDENDKCPAIMAKEHLQVVLHSVKSLNIKAILITDSKYFKYLTGQQKPAQNFLGYKMPCSVAGYEGAFDIFYAPNYLAAKHNPKITKEVDTALASFKRYLQGIYAEPGQSVIHSARYPESVSDIRAQLAFLASKPILTVDIETRGLKFYNCGIASIAFAWDEHNFIAMPVDRGPDPAAVKQLLREFFDHYPGKLIPHNGGFDFKVLIYELWMKDLQDYPGMIQGIRTLTRDFEDTKLITYLATNNAVENVLKLKILAAEYMGNYAEENITNTDVIPLPQLLEYNGKDTLATWYVCNKYWSMMIASNQQTIYEELFKPTMITLLQTELTGMPIFPEKVANLKRRLLKRRRIYSSCLENSSIIKEFQLDVRARKCAEFTAAAKKKVFSMDDPRIERITFNPNSPLQVGDLLFNYLGFPVLDTTDTGQPSTGGDTLEKLLNHTKNVGYKTVLRSLIGLAQVDKILTSFIPAFENAVQVPDGSYRLYGNFNLGGTVSGRLSCVAPWTPIVTNRGEIPIYQVTVGDLVHTHKGNWKPVTKTIYKGLDYMVDVRLCNGKIFSCTIDHKVLLSSGEWKTIKEILNVNFQNLGDGFKQHQQSGESLPIVAQRNDHGKNCCRIANDSTQRFACASQQHDSTGIDGDQTGQIFDLKDRQQESNEGQIPGTASQLEGGVLGQQGVLDNPVERAKDLCSSCCHDGSLMYHSTPRRNGRTSYRQQSIEQCIRQSCFDYRCRTQTDSLFAGTGQPGIEIKEINYRGSTPVYDLTVQDDASYLSCGFYSHNSSDPNLQNLPANSAWGKMVKRCFGCISSWLFGGADFNSLEDMVAALTTRDTNKMAVYLDGYDGHSIRAYSYFREKMPDIVQAVNKGRSFKIEIAGKITILPADTMVLCPDGHQRTIGDYYDLQRTP